LKKLTLAVGDWWQINSYRRNITFQGNAQPTQNGESNIPLSTFDCGKIRTVDMQAVPASHPCACAVPLWIAFKFKSSFMTQKVNGLSLKVWFYRWLSIDSDARPISART
jgi:hypothetical protein